MIPFPFFCQAILVLLCSFVPFFTLSAQEQTVEFGAFTHDELRMNECSFDKNADAVVLLDHAVAFFNDDYNLITERRIRIKILKEKGIERGDIRIPYYSNEGFEFIRDIEGIVITPTQNDEVSIHPLEKKNVFRQQVNNLYSVMSFALPNVKVGSIIDYKYKSIMKSYGGLKSWEFQKEIPVVTSSYQLSPLPNSEFTYTLYKAPDLPVKVVPDNKEGKVLFVMEKIPGLRDEVYMTTTRSFLQRVNFQFASYTDHRGKSTYTTTWKQLATELMDEKLFGSQADKDLSGTALLKSLPPVSPALEKLRFIHQFVKRNIVWEEINSKYSENGSKATLEKRKGNSGDINLLLVSLLKSAGIEAYPLLVSERDHGIVDTSYSFLDQFNKVVAYAIVEGKSYVLDGTDKDTPFFLVPPDLLNTTAFMVDKKKYRFVYLNNLPQKQSERVSVTGRITAEGLFEGQAQIAENEYAKLSKESRFHQEKTRYLEALIKPHSFLKVDSFSVTGLGDDSAALQQDLSFHFNLKKSGAYHLLNYNLFTGLSENPFMTQYRFTDIDFGTKYSGIFSGNFSLPPNFVAETLPVNKKIVSPDRSMSASRRMEIKDNTLNTIVVISIDREKYAAEEYEEVKAFFKEMVDLLNEPVLLKTK